MDRRAFLLTGVAASGVFADDERSQASHRFPAAATTTEVIGDGSWVWTHPPKGKKGLLEPRTFEFRTRIQMRGTGHTTGITSTTAVPVELPEQRIVDSTIRTQGCTASFRQVAPAAAQMILSAPALRPGGVLGAEAVFRMTMYKQFFDYRKEQFPIEQEFPKEFLKVYLFNSPGIQTRPSEVRKLAASLADQLTHPWDKARAFKKWVWKNIASDKAMKYSGVASAIRTGVGDCEERACVFAALCRLHGIPTRTVWVPNHVWAEFCLKDHEGVPHWIPAHTSGYTWFGLTGAHELVMQKGDGVKTPDQRREMRFIHDWSKFTGSRPEIFYTSEFRPLPSKLGADPGPGARIKAAEGPWTAGRHELDKYLLNGDKVKESPFKKFKEQVRPWE